MVECELLKLAARAAAARGESATGLTTCDFYALGICPGVQPQTVWEQTPSTCPKLKDTTQALGQVEKFLRRQELTARGRPLPAGA
ncbi:MAG: hypothetical protein HY344_01000 [Candidatus Levybacteria bacterium]|nr:hypothetical protein [Candidatus Levybacteria bacterium]